MKYYGIYFTDDTYKVVKRKTSMVNNRDWLKKEYGVKAKAYQSISMFHYWIYKIIGKGF